MAGSAESTEAVRQSAENEEFRQRLQDAANDATARIVRPKITSMIWKLYKQLRGDRQS